MDLGEPTCQDAVDGARAALLSTEQPHPEVLDAVWDGLLGVPVTPTVPQQLALRSSSGTTPLHRRA